MAKTLKRSDAKAEPTGTEMPKKSMLSKYVLAIVLYLLIVAGILLWVFG